MGRMRVIAVTAAPAVAVVAELGVQHQGARAVQLQLGRTGVHVEGGDGVDEVVVLAGERPGAGHHHVDQHLALAVPDPLRAVDVHAGVRAAEGLVVVETQGVAEPRGLGAPALAALQA